MPLRRYEPPTYADLRRHVEARYRAIEARNREPDAQALLAAARADAAAAARLLRERFGATRVRLFGSLARGDCDLARGFDIDLAVEGIDAGAFFRAWNAAADVVGDRKLDLVDWRDATPLLRQRIEEDGVELP